MIAEHFLSILIFTPVFLALCTVLVPDSDDNRLIHYYGIGGSLALFLFSMLGWTLPGATAPILTPAAEYVPWISSLGISYALGSDGLTMTMVILTTFLLFVSAVASWSNIKKRVKLYYAMVFLLIASILGVFLARDMFLFFLFWELELIPMYLLIAIWGGPNRKFAAMKFVLYTLFGSLFLVVGMLALYFHARSSGVDANTIFLYNNLAATAQAGLPLATQLFIFTCLFITFAVKLPMVPFHTWLPDAHVEAPTPISMLLAGILLKMGAYGMLRFCWGWLPEAAVQAGPYVALLAMINIVYTAGVALVQTDMKKLIAYSSVSHMGFVLLGLAALNAIGFNGAVFVMFSHGLVSAALFMCVGTLYLRTHSRAIADYGGFGVQTPTIFYFFMFMGMASLGLPLLVSFASESLVFYGAYLSNAFSQISLFGQTLNWSIQSLTIASALGVIIGAGYILWLLKRVFFGELNEKWKTLPDATPSEVFVLATLGVFVLLFGLFPTLITQQFEADVTALAGTYQNIRLSDAETTGPSSDAVLVSTGTMADTMTGNR